MQEIQSVRFIRECEVTQIPSGQQMTMGADTPVDITQSLGGAYTVRSPQGLFRVDARDADALGFEVPDEAKPRESGAPATEQEIWESLKQVYDPEIPVNIYDLGLIYGVEVDDESDVTVTMTLTTPHCPVAETMPGEVELRAASVPGVRDAEVNLVWDPPWGPDKMTDEARLELGML